MVEQEKTRISVLISGNGTNLQALIDAKENVLQNCTIVRVISNRKAAYGLTRAKEANIPTAYHNVIQAQFEEDREMGLGLTNR